MSIASIPVRDLGARGSRSSVGDADPAGLLSVAAARVAAAVPEWWEARAREAGLSGSSLDVSEAVAALQPGGLDEFAADPSIGPSTSGAALGAAYVAALSPDVRARHGRHYTPDDLAAHLWTMTRRALRLPTRASTLPGLIRDPACGAGALLLPALREHVTASVRTDPLVALAGLPNVVEGVDSDPVAVWLANVALAAEALPLLSAVPARRRRPIPALARVGDGLVVPTRLARAVVVNPPYGRVKLGPAERERWRHVLYGHANLYGLFLAAAVEGLAEGGVLGALVPTSFTSGLYFSRLRGFLADEAPLREAAFVVGRDGVFADVLQETCLAIFDRRRARRVTIESLNGSVTSVAQVKSPRTVRPWLLPRRADDAPTAAVAAGLPLRLADLGYRCSTGPLVWNRRAADLGPRNGTGRVPVLWAADVDGGTVHRDRARDRLRFLRLRGRDEDVLVLAEAAVLVQRTTAPEQTRRLVAVDLSPGTLAAWGGRVVVENHVNVLRPIVSEPLLSRETLAAVLATEPLDRVMRSLSGSVAVSAYELTSVPFPAADVLRTWNGLVGEELARAVAAAYQLKD